MKHIIPLKNLRRLLNIFFIHIRVLKATRDIKAGEIIFEEPPVFAGPSKSSKPICLVCLNEVRHVSSELLISTFFNMQYTCHIFGDILLLSYMNL